MNLPQRSTNKKNQNVVTGLGNAEVRAFGSHLKAAFSTARQLRPWLRHICVIQ